MLQKMLGKKFRNAVYEGQSHNYSLKLVILALLAIISWMYHGWQSAPENLTLHIPPDLSQGAQVKPHDPNNIPKANVFQFTNYVYQQLNRWEEDGSKDFPKNIFMLQAFLSDSYKIELQKRADEKTRMGELQKRTRGIQLTEAGLFKDALVQKVSDEGIWNVTLIIRVKEHHNSTGLLIKDATIKTPLRVVRVDIDQEKNPWGLVIDGGDEKAEREVTKSGSSKSGTGLTSMYGGN